MTDMTGEVNAPGVAGSGAYTSGDHPAEGHAAGAAGANNPVTPGTAAGAASEAARAARLPAASHPANAPIPVWPDGVLAVAAGFTLLAIGLRHRYYLQRKAREMQRVVEEFQRQGGLDELRQVARQASEFFGKPS
jgi:hypothetical protein